MAFLRALALLGTLLLLALVMARVNQAPLPISLSWGTPPNDWRLTATAPVVVALGVFTLLVFFYLGQFASWLGQLPRSWGQIFSMRRHTSTLAALTQAFAALQQGDTPQATKIATSLHPNPGPEADLTHLLNLQLGRVSPTEAEALLTHPQLGSLMRKALVQGAATHGNWAEVRRLTTGLTGPAQTLPLLTLRLKALLNLSDPAATGTLPLLKPHLPSQHYKLLATVVNGPSSTEARTLGHPWMPVFRDWLATPSDTLPPL